MEAAFFQVERYECDTAQLGNIQKSLETRIGRWVRPHCVPTRVYDTASQPWSERGTGKNDPLL